MFTKTVYNFHKNKNFGQQQTYRLTYSFQFSLPNTMYSIGVRATAVNSETTYTQRKRKRKRDDDCRKMMSTTAQSVREKFSISKHENSKLPEHIANFNRFFSVLAHPFRCQWSYYEFFFSIEDELQSTTKDFYRITANVVFFSSSAKSQFLLFHLWKVQLMFQTPHSFAFTFMSFPAGKGTSGNCNKTKWTKFCTIFSCWFGMFLNKRRRKKISNKSEKLNFSENIYWFRRMSRCEKITSGKCLQLQWK